GARRDEFAAFVVVHPETHAVAQLYFVHPAGAAERQDHSLPPLPGELEDRIGLFGVVDDLGMRAGLNAALEVERDAGRRRRPHIEGVEGQRCRAAQLEAAAGEEERSSKNERSHDMTMFISRPGTTIFRRTSLPSMYLLIAVIATDAVCSLFKPAG